MKFKTRRESKTGKKIAEIEKKAQKAIEVLSNDLGFKSWRIGYWCAFGGCCCVMFDEEPNIKLWKSQEDGYFPKKNSNAGKELAKKLEDLPTVSLDDLNQSVGFDGAPWKHIGVNFNNKDFFGFEVGDDWKFETPDDCEEITVSSFNKMFD